MVQSKLRSIIKTLLITFECKGIVSEPIWEPVWEPIWESVWKPLWEPIWDMCWYELEEAQYFLPSSNHQLFRSSPLLSNFVNAIFYRLDVAVSTDFVRFVVLIELHNALCWANLQCGPLPSYMTLRTKPTSAILQCDVSSYMTLQPKPTFAISYIAIFGRLMWHCSLSWLTRFRGHNLWSCVLRS